MKDRAKQHRRSNGTMNGITNGNISTIRQHSPTVIEDDTGPEEDDGLEEDDEEEDEEG